MHIEVSYETFYKIFGENPIKLELKEQYEKTYFENKQLYQSGFKLFNYASSKKCQYYLTDINA